MSGVATLFLIVNALALLALPRRWAALPLLVGACYMTLGQGVQIGPFRFTVIRMLVLAGMIRIAVRNERPGGGLNGLDAAMIAWGVWAVFSSFFHQSPTEALVFRLGLAYNGLGLYFLLRTFCQTTADLVQIVRITAFLLLPVAVEMLSEKLTGRNNFAILGGVPESVAVRNGSLRAQGPFGHAILAGTVGGLCIPLMVGIWRRHPFTAKVGLAACLSMVFASASSGPLMTTVLATIALLLWPWRRFTGKMRAAAVIAYILLDIVMKAPAYFLIARIDLTGGSTGYHRAALIQSAITYVNEWWLTGTDYTRHWMPYGVSWSPDHADITNQYLQNGVHGGLPLMLIYIAGLWLAFCYVGQALRKSQAASPSEQFLIWSLGAGLFAHAATGLSVSYFDQSIVFLYLNMAVIGSLRSASAAVDQTTAYSSSDNEAHDLCGTRCTP